MSAAPRNWIAGDIGAGVTLEVEVPAEAKAGDVAWLAAAGDPLVYVVHEPVNGKAACRMLPTDAVIELPVDGTLTVGERVWVLLDDPGTGDEFTYTVNEDDDRYHVGHVVAVPGRSPASGSAFVYLGTSTFAVGEDASGS